jgi:outer membrane protein OmpA-like peptidoglycan-associated protein
MLQDRGVAAIDNVACMSPVAGTLLRWVLSQLHDLRKQLPARTNEKQRERQKAESHLQKLVIQEDSLVTDVLAKQLESLPGHKCSQTDADRLLSETMVTFSRGSALMSSLSARRLAGMLEVLKRDRDVNVMILGCGGADEEKSLPLKRAHVVSKYLQSQGIAEERLSCAFTNGAPGVRFSNSETAILQGIYNFAPCSDALRPEAAVFLGSVASFLKEIPFIRFSVEGHSDTDPMWLGNLALSEARADRVAGQLRKLGVPEDQLMVIAHGERRPRMSNNDEEGKATNRRVELHLALQQSINRLCRRPNLCELLPDQARSTLFELAVVAADACACATGFAMRQAAAEALVARGAHWGAKLLSQSAWG